MAFRKNLFKNPAFHLVPIMLVAFSSLEIAARSAISIEGKILEKKTIKEDSGPYRYRIIYNIQDKTGRTRTYSAEGNDHSLSRDLSVGDFLVKKPGHLDYLVNNEPRIDFPIKFYASILGIGLILLLLSWSYLISLAVRILRT